MAVDTVTINIDTVEKELWDKIVETAEGGGSGAGLPEVTSDDNGDLLGVVEGAWGKVDPPAELPAVSSTDNGSLLGVSDGAWAKVANGAPLVITCTTDETTVTITTPLADIKAAVDNGRIVVLLLGPFIIPLSFIAEDGAHIYLGFSVTLYNKDELAVENYSVAFSDSLTGSVIITKLATAT